ncbi:Hypothetical predicted protein [Octopus vulgaris]|uniref:Uncharacterized protein n=1 Tax=Octopus vulgaris TaxID=6645 RepID=A0AA36BYD8_OCTVU|nr:Hypothetical predicted protein [Octopus vulgaris]
MSPDFARISRVFHPCICVTSLFSLTSLRILTNGLMFLLGMILSEDLVCPYKGPFRVLSCAPKTFSFAMNGRAETVSVNILKRAHFEVSTTFADTPNTFSPLQPPTHAPLTISSPTPSSPLPNTNRPCVTRTGRTMHWPKKTH